MRLPFQLLAPSGLWLLAAIGPLLALYVLRTRRRRVRVGSVWLWRAAERDLRAERPWRRLQAEIPLVLEALAIVLLALALARPTLRTRALVGEHVAIVVDVSASMRAREPGGEARIDLAKRAAIAALDTLAPGSDALVVAAAGEPRVVATTDRDVDRLRRAVESLDALDVEGSLAAAVSLAADRLRERGGSGRVAVFTDGAEAVPDPGLPVATTVVGTPLDNVGIIRADVRVGRVAGAAGDGDEVQAFALVASFAKARRSLYVTLREPPASDTLASRRIEIAPGERVPVVLSFRPSRGDAGHALAIELSPGDALATDDVAWARVPPGRAATAFLASDAPAPWLLRALASDPDLDVQRGRVAEAAGAPDDALLVVAGACPEDAAGRDVLVVAPPRGRCFGVEVGAEVERATPTSWAVGDPRLRFLSLDAVHVARARSLVPSSASAALVRAGETVLVADASSPGRTVTIVGLDPADSDWPLQASFPMFVRDVVELARAHRAHGAETRARAGGAIELSVPRDVERVALVDPAENERAVRARDGVAVLADLSRAGIWHASWQDARPGSVVVPVTLASERESDLATRAALANAASAPATTAALASPRDLGAELAWLALALLALDVAWLGRGARSRVAARRGAA